jgi:hypothetical protein
MGGSMGEQKQPGNDIATPTTSGFWNLEVTLWIGAVFSGIGSAIVWLTVTYHTEGGAPYALLLLLISPILLIIGFPARAKPPKWFTFLYVALEVWKNVLLWSYALMDRSILWAESFSFVAIVVACLILAGSLVIARWAIGSPERHGAIRTHFFATICGALYLFAHVSYDLTFALALHDRRGVAGGIYSVPKQTNSDTYTLHFTEGQASIDTVVPLAMLIPEWPADPDGQCEAVQAVTQDKSDSAIREMAFDVGEWKRLTTKIATDRPSWWRVSITGHASDAISEGNGKLKNLSLSEERMEQTRAAIRQKLRELRPDVRIEWALRAISNDDQFVGRKFLDGKNHKLSVEIQMERERKFELLDYAYFMIYTITTTGYGDLMPTSPRAKFITCLANIFELLFIVVLLNLAFCVYGRD